jgi:serine/threonine protein kinase
LQGVFSDGATLHVASELASLGDLFDWSASRRRPSMGANERGMHPIVVQLFRAVQLLHELGVAHRDLSLENVVLTRPEGDYPGAAPVVKLIDFGQANIGRFVESDGSDRSPCGKDAYVAPELYRVGSHDAFLSDTFSLGVIVFSLAISQYPWTSTTPSSTSMRTARLLGMRSHLQSLTLHGVRLPELLSPALLDLLCAMLEPSPARRACLGESCFQDSRRLSVWGSAWLAEPQQATARAPQAPPSPRKGGLPWLLVELAERYIFDSP